MLMMADLVVFKCALKNCLPLTNYIQGVLGNTMFGNNDNHQATIK